jgi:hypothetical protein
MFINASLPIIEKVYLADKTLSYVQDLKVGDKILSLKITEQNVNSISDIYKNYINNGQRFFSNYEIGEATIFSAEKKDYVRFDQFKNKKIVNSQYIITRPFFLYNVTNLNQDIAENSLMISTTKEIKKSYANSEKIYNNVDEIELSYQTAQLSKNVFSDPDRIIDFQSTGKINKFPSLSTAYSLSIVGGHFYFTENFIVLAETGL